ncbi:MAG: CoA transferase [Gammaproteobacteria bacterium]|nr:CoA transferase [Gammaproteobacteria bacterium]
MARGPLEDVRILDLTHVWAGPLATRILGDLGAQILKIEAPMSRGPRVYPTIPLGSFIGGEPGDEPWNANAVFVKLMRNKKSIALDLKTEVGRSTFLELVAISDVVIENFSARAMASLELDYEHLKQANPEIIHVAMPGYGLSGPYSERVAFGPTVEPMSGLTSVMGYSAEEPRATAMAVPDPTSAVNATAAVVTALRMRDLTGKGRLVEMSLHESATSYSGPWLIDTQLGHEPTQIGNRHPELTPHGIYPCFGNDSWIAIGCRSDSEFQALCDICELEVDRNWTLSERKANESVLDEAIARWTCDRYYDTIVESLSIGNIPVGGVFDTERMLANPQSVSRGFFVPIERDTPIPGNPIKMDGISSDDWMPCPKLGEHNEEVLEDWLDYDPDRIQALYDDGIIVNRPPR